MYDTMYNAEGVGLAAPQIGLPIRVFLVDASPFAEDESLSEDERETLKNFKCTFVNAELLIEEGDEWTTLSIPYLHESELVSDVLWHGEDAILLSPQSARNTAIRALELIVKSHG